MAGYKSTTSIPNVRERLQRQIDFDNTGGTTEDIWTPTTGKRITIDDVIISISVHPAISLLACRFIMRDPGAI